MQALPKRDRALYRLCRMSDLSTQPPLPVRSHAASDALGLWEPKRTLTLEAARRHTDRIALLRKILIGASIALVALLVYYFATQGAPDVIEDDPDTSVRMINPRYSGRTADGLPFYLTSDTATRQLMERNQVTLIKPVLEFIRASGAASSFVEADGGMYNDVEKILDLRSNPDLAEDIRQDVMLETDDGYECQTTHARIFARDKRIVGEDSIRCTGEFGVVEGQAYEINDNYRTYVFKDGMNGVINRESDRQVGLRGTPATDATQPRPVFGFDGDGPITVTAERAVYKGGVTELFGDVIVIQDDSTIYADQMTILRDQAVNTPPGSLRLGAVREITGTGNFRYVSAENDVRGDVGIYNRETSQMIVTGQVSVVQPGGNSVSTDRLVYDTISETIRFSGQCRGRDCGDNSRTRVVIEQ